MTTTTRTRRDLATNVMRSLGLVDATAMPSAADLQFVIDRATDVLAEMVDDDMVYWDDPDLIPAQIYDALTKLVGLTVAPAFGVPVAAESEDNAREIFLRRIRSHTGKKRSRLPVEVEDF